MLPPACLILLGFVGLWLSRRRFALGFGLVAASLGLLYVLSTPLFADWALSLLTPPYVDPKSQVDQVQAMVVLGGGTYGPAPEYGTDMVSRLTLMRTRYAAKLYRMTGKPMLVSGGSVSGDTSSEASQMRALLTQELGVPVQWLEERSRDTLGNALESHRILAPAGIKSIFLVTHSWHIPRARLAFEHAGFQVVPAPTAFASVDAVGLADLVPRASALLNSYYFFHEVFGYAWYVLRIRLF